MQLTLVTGDYFRFINLISLFIITYKILLSRTHVNYFKKSIRMKFLNGCSFFVNFAFRKIQSNNENFNSWCR